MDLRQLRYFAAVAHSGSFTGASRALHISQPALGYQVKHLEQTLGTDLLLRHSRGVVPTEAGKLLLRHVERILADVEAAEAALDPFRRKLVGDVALGVTPTSGRALVPDLLKLCAAQTGLRIALRQGMSNGLLAETLAGALDMAFCYDPPEIERTRPVALYREALFLIGPPDLVGPHRQDLAFATLEQFPLLLDNRLQNLRQLVETIAAERGVALNVTLEIEPINLKREMIVHYRRCTIVPYGLFRDEIRSGELRARRIVEPTLMRTMNLVLRPSLPESVGTFMLSAIRTIVAECIAEGELGWLEAS